MLLSPIDHKHAKRDIKGDGTELWQDFANSINSPNYNFIAFTQLFMNIFHHFVPQLRAFYRGDNKKLTD